MATTLQASIDTTHQDMIHDAQMDYYGRRLATCSSDRTIRIFEVHGDKNTLIKELTGHDGPVWQVAWAHPKFGNILASCSYDRRVLIWKETSTGFQQIYEHIIHESSVNSIAWAPPDLSDTTMYLACGSSDGSISLLQCQGGNWHSQRTLDAHKIGVTSVSWSNIYDTGNQRTFRLVSGGCDNLIKIWVLDEIELTQQGEPLNGHADWVRDVAWAPGIGINSTIASCSQDGNVCIWTEDKTSKRWKQRKLMLFPGPVWRVSWSISGDLLAISTSTPTGENKVSLWKESLTDEWVCLSEIEDGNAL